MKKIVFLLMVVIPLNLHSQFNQKVSFNLSAGTFKTFGTKYTEASGPMQFPNYKAGFSGTAGIQIKLNDRFSIEADFGIMISNRWNYSTQDIENWSYWTIDDTLTGQVLEEGENYLDFHNFSVSVNPKFYLMPGKKWNPYFSAGISINWTRCWFENSYWYALKDMGMLGPEETEPWNDFLEESFGIGIYPGFGVEYNNGKMFGFYFNTGYSFIGLDETKFKDPDMVENFNAFFLNAGIRLYFIKSKDL